MLSTRNVVVAEVRGSCSIPSTLYVIVAKLLMSVPDAVPVARAACTITIKNRLLTAMVNNLFMKKALLITYAVASTCTLVKELRFGYVKDFEKEPEI
jgi:hypothetical protein